MIDALLIQTVTRFIRADFEVVTAIFEALAGANARRDAFLAAAQEALSTEDFNILQAVMTVIAPSRKRRNIFVHHIWGSAPELPDAILLAPPPVVTRYLLEIKIKLRDMEPGQDFTPPPRSLDFSKILVFKQNDLKEDFKTALECADYAMSLDLMFSPVSQSRDTTRDELLSQPLIQQQFQRFSAQDSPQQSPEQPE